jgi:hypothetical protein
LQCSIIPARKGKIFKNRGAFTTSGGIMFTQAKKISSIKKILILAGIIFSLIIIAVVAYGGDKPKKSHNINESQVEPVVPEVEIKIFDTHYQSEEEIRIRIKNIGEIKPFIWFGPCSVALEKFENGSWAEIKESWSLCPACVEREMLEPRFINPSESTVINWDQILTWCVDGIREQKLASGIYRLNLNYAEDNMNCQASLNIRNCWTNNRNKLWHNKYSNKFIIGN